MNFGFDITMCEGENCNKKESCLRYTTLQEYRRSPRDISISVLKPQNPDKCVNYWSNNEN